METAFLGTVSTLEGERWKLEVDVRNVSRTFKVDTVADVPVVPDRIYRDVFKNVSLQSPEKLLKCPSQKTLTVFGVMNETLHYRLELQSGSVYCRGIEQPLLLRDASEQLGIVHRLDQVDSCGVVRSTQKENIQNCLLDWATSRYRT